MRLPTGQLPTLQPDVLFPHANSFLSYTEVDRISSRPVAYIATEFAASLFPSNGQFVIGDRQQPNDMASLYTNAPLLAGSNYSFFLRAFPIDCIVSGIAMYCSLLNFMLSSHRGQTDSMTYSPPATIVHQSKFLLQLESSEAYQTLPQYPSLWLLSFW